MQGDTSTGPRGVAFWGWARRHPTKAAVIEASGRVTTYAELASLSNQIANGLISLGARRGDTVAVAMHNTAELFAIALATHQIGLYYVPVNYHLAAAEMKYIVEDAAPKMLFGDERCAAACATSGQVNAMTSARLVAIGKVPGFRSLEDFAAQYSDERPTSRSAGGRMYYTSGTTGRPKGVLRPLPTGDPDEELASYARQMLVSKSVPTIGSDQIHLAAGPMYHGGPLGFAFAALMLGQTVVLMDKWDAKATVELIDRHKITWTHLVPTMFVRLLALPEGEKQRFSGRSLECVLHAGAPCPRDVKRAMIDWWGPMIYEYYAASEGGGTSATPEEWLKRPGTVGRPKPGNELAILDEEGEALPAGDVGHIYFRTKQAFEYRGDPAKTAAAHRGDWFTVGDVGYVDDDGYLYIVDRVAETIISGGVNIYPAEIEAVLIGHPGVKDVAVIGVPDTEWGEQVRAVVERTNLPVTASELIDWCRDRLSAFKCPRAVDFVDELPRDSNGKLYRRRLRAHYGERADA